MAQRIQSRKPRDTSRKNQRSRSQRLGPQHRRPVAGSASGAFNPRDLLLGLAMVLLGALFLAAMLHAAQTLKFNALGGISSSIYNVITGLGAIGNGLGQVLIGIAQLLGLAAAAVASVAAVLAILTGVLRVGLQALPQLGQLWRLLSQSMLVLLQLAASPLSGGLQVRPHRPEQKRRKPLGHRNLQPLPLRPLPLQPMPVRQISSTSAIERI